MTPRMFGAREQPRRTRPPIELAGTRRIWLYNGILLGGCVLLWVAILRHLGHPPAPSIGVPWWALALVFYLAEAHVVHVHVRREAHTISLNEIALVIGLYILSPGTLLLAQFVGAAAAFGFARRQRPTKLVFNLLQLTLTTSVAIVIFRTIVGLGDPFGFVGWGAAMLAAVTASLLGILLVTLAIAIAQGELTLQKLPTTAGISIVTTIATANIALVGIELARADYRTLALLALPAAIVVLAFRSVVSQARQHEHLEFLYQSMKATRSAPEFSLAIGQLLITVRQLVRAEYAEIFLFPAGGNQGLRSSLGTLGDMAAHPDLIGPDDQQVLTALGDSADAVLLPAPRPLHPLDGYLAARALPDGVIATLRGDDGPFGLLIVGDRSGDINSFGHDDKKLLETFVGHASVLLENGRLERSLAEVTDLKEQLGHQAFHDILTGLPNRALLTERVEAAIAAGGTSAALLFLDLDDFKTVNDTLGHSIGDEVLVEVARRVQRSVRPGDTAARLGGDEFAVLLEATDEKGTEVVAASLIEAMKKPFDLAGRETHIHASVGIAFACSAGSADELLRNADVAMYSAKAAGKHRYSHYEPVMHAKVRRRHEFARELQGAVDRDEIGVVFEPIVDLRDGRVVMFEALARWNSPERGVVQPLEFIPVAEEIGLMMDIGRSVLRQSCQAARTWQNSHPDQTGIGVSVNLSPAELANDDFADDVAQALLASGLSAESLTLEITESDVMWNLEAAHTRMLELRALGVRLALDDFGTGRSSLERLDTFPLNAVKIAKPFVDKLLDASSDPSFIDAFVRLGYSLDIECIAEGIEHADQVPRLLDRGCALGQGFLFAPPMAVGEVDAYLAARLRHEEPSDQLNLLTPSP